MKLFIYVFFINEDNIKDTDNILDNYSCLHNLQEVFLGENLAFSSRHILLLIFLLEILTGFPINKIIFFICFHIGNDNYNFSLVL